jgi:hypothetical protein
LAPMSLAPGQPSPPAPRWFQRSAARRQGISQTRCGPDRSWPRPLIACPSESRNARSPVRSWSHSLLLIAAPQLPRFRVRRPHHRLKPSPVSRGVPWFPSWTCGGFFSSPQRESRHRVAGRVGKFLWSLSQPLALLPSVTQAYFRFAPAAQVGVIPAIGDLRDGEAVDLPSAAGDTNGLLRLSSFWPPISDAEQQPNQPVMPLR